MAILQMTINVEDVNEDHRFDYTEVVGNWIVDWGDAYVEINTRTHRYKEAGLYQITVKGNFIIEQLRCPTEIVSLVREEGCGIISLENCFLYCNQLISAPQGWDVSKVTNMISMFGSAKSFNQDISAWDVSSIVKRFNMFVDCPIEEKHKPLNMQKGSAMLI